MDYMVVLLMAITVGAVAAVVLVWAGLRSGDPAGRDLATDWQEVRSGQSED